VIQPHHRRPIRAWHAGLHAAEVEASLRATGFVPRAQIVWTKDRFALSRGDYHWQHEPCWYAVREGCASRRSDDRSQSTVWAVAAREDAGHGHGTQKPVEVMARPIRNHNGAEVYDPFLGSGTTLIAAEQLGRRSFRARALLLVLAISCGDCVLLPAPRSAYRPIHQRATNGDAANVASDLAANPTDRDLPDDAGRTPLHLAASRCHTEVVLLLLSKGAPIDRQAADGATALHLAAQEACLETVPSLLAHGANVNARDKERRTPLKRAEQWGQEAVATFLRAHGGTE
jgi:hypothetical protein